MQVKKCGIRSESSKVWPVEYVVDRLTNPGLDHCPHSVNSLKRSSLRTLTYSYYGRGSEVRIRGVKRVERKLGMLGFVEPYSNTLNTLIQYEYGFVVVLNVTRCCVLRKTGLKFAMAEFEGCIFQYGSEISVFY
jgi:hypothetical protein